MARAVTTHPQSRLNTVLAWAVALLLFFPILWTDADRLQDRGEAIASPPDLPAASTGRSRTTAPCRSDPTTSASMNSVVISFGSTLLGLIIAIPAAWSMAFVPTSAPRTS
jgi:sorbitol/mannitol transport system permease protein